MAAVTSRENTLYGVGNVCIFALFLSHEFTHYLPGDVRPKMLLTVSGELGFGGV